jgi:membrane protein YqaA with SNARE-associated domain
MTANWLETPRGLAVFLSAVAAMAAAFGGWVGYGIGQNASPPQIVFQPGAIVVQQAPVAHP